MFPATFVEQDVGVLLGRKLVFEKKNDGNVLRDLI